MDREEWMKRWKARWLERCPEDQPVFLTPDALLEAYEEFREFSGAPEEAVDMLIDMYGIGG